MSQPPKRDSIPAKRASAFVDIVGLELLSLDQDGCNMQLEITPQHFNGTGRVHGGVIFTLLDSAMGGAVYARLDADESAATIEAKINYTRAVTDGVVECRAKVMHAGTRTMVVDGEVWQNGALVAKCLGTFARI